jgi:hypothetical protein
MTQLEVLAESVDRKGRTDKLGKSKGEELEVSEVLDSLQAGYVFAHQAVSVFARPAPRFGL